MRSSRREWCGLALGALVCGASRGLRSWAASESTPAQSPGPNEIFLRDQARRIVASARVGAGEKSGTYHNTTPHDVRVPGGNMGYPAYWIRDSVMMLGGDLIPPREIEGWIRLIFSTIRGPEDWQVRPGVVVPAWAVPDHINFDGKATFYPGNYETGDKQGGPPWGKYPPLDDNFFFLRAVHEHWRLTKDLGLFHSIVRTHSGEGRLADLCEKIYRMPPSDEATGLVVAGDIERENAKDWGFCDAVSKSGWLLFPSILKREAARGLGNLFEAAGEEAKAASYRADAVRIAAALEATFLRPTADGSEAWLHSATGVGHQPDVWGSALAVHSGALSTAAARQVSRALARAFRKRTAVRDGFIRHVPTDDPRFAGSWEKALSAPGEYQNGGYWGTPTGWYVSALSVADPASASDLAQEYVRFLRAHMRADGMSEAWEWVNPESGARANPLYVATVALPYLSLESAGLLHLLDGRAK